MKFIFRYFWQLLSSIPRSLHTGEMCKFVLESVNNMLKNLLSCINTKMHLIKETSTCNIFKSLHVFIFNDATENECSLIPHYSLIAKAA